MYTKILVPLDGSKRAEKILTHVAEMARCTGAMVQLLEVVPPVYYVMDPQISYMDINLEETKFRVEEAEKYLEERRQELTARGLVASTLVEQGPIVETIIEVARQQNADLIAMASHGRSGLGRVFYGSVAAGVLQQVDRPLLLVRSRDDD